MSDRLALTADDIARAVQANVFFAHQSVGQNILDGVRELAPSRRLAWVDANVGLNGDPLSKIDAFHEAVTTGVGRHAELAFMKLCYVDFDARTDEGAVFARYRNALAALARERPRTILLHVTVPLTVVGSGPRAWLARALGRPAWGERDNAKRDAYNDRMRAEYGTAGSLFDLAEIEAGTAPGAARTRTPRLQPHFTDDGGHLNAQGRRFVATELLVFVSRALARRAGAKDT
jgi:hypothetical protein